MVTLRRDIAAQKSGKKENLTNYDVFMQDKNNDNRNKNVTKRDTGVKSYEEYLFDQLNRTKSDGAILTEEQYNKKYLKPLKESAAAEKPVTVKRQLTKFGKIFLSVYVLLTLVVASIILVANNESEPVNANDGGIEREIEG